MRTKELLAEMANTARTKVGGHASDKQFIDAYCAELEASMETCKVCGQKDVIPGHDCGQKYTGSCVGIDAIEVWASDPAKAAERFAELVDRSVKYSMCCSGEALQVAITDQEGNRTEWEVRGRAVPTYSATEPGTPVQDAVTDPDLRTPAVVQGWPTEDSIRLMMVQCAKLLEVQGKGAIFAMDHGDRQALLHHLTQIACIFKILSDQPDNRAAGQEQTIH